MNAFALLLLAASAPAPGVDPSLEAVINQVSAEPGSGKLVVDVRILNDGEDDAAFTFPEKLTARAGNGDSAQILVLMHEAGAAQSVTVAPHTFVKALYVLAGTSALVGMTLSIPEWKSAEVRVGTPNEPTSQALAEAATSPAPLSTGVTNPAPGDRKVGNAFIDNLGPYEPIYAVYGPGTNTEARIQISFKYRLFGSRREHGLAPSWRDGLHFAFTQRMFWDVGAESSPFRNIDYLPELFYLAPPVVLKDGLAVSGQIGVRHESNGRAGLQSRSLNSIYVAPMASAALGGGYRLLVGPRLSFLIGDKSDNPDILRYRGATSLFMELGKEDGLRLSTSTRFNFSSGKGAVGVDLSYPLNRLWSGGPDLYLFGQGFTGYGENLLDYDRKATRLRIGLAIVR
ncbi:phospholipase A [Sphingobium yanoikuyae]|uniref:phospholipase A n=1 Tax=Sphingobium yanoikuyae TaxID=13690 RepID=UPI00241FF543|nr:phospholipase A [Sphingobium yanoikuyae]